MSRGVPRRYPLQPPGHLQIELIPLIFFFFPFFLFPRSMSIKIKAVLSPLVAGPGAGSPQQGFSPTWAARPREPSGSSSRCDSRAAALRRTKFAE